MDERKKDTTEHLAELERAGQGEKLEIYKRRGMSKPVALADTPENKDEREKQRLENISVLAEMMSDKELLLEFDTWVKRAEFFDVSTDTIRKWYRSREFTEAVVQFLSTLSALAVIKATPNLADKAMAGNIKAFEALSRNANPKNQALQQKTELNQTNINISYDGFLRELSQRSLPRAVDAGLPGTVAEGEATLPQNDHSVEVGPGTLLRRLPENTEGGHAAGAVPIQHSAEVVPPES